MQLLKPVWPFMWFLPISLARYLVTLLVVTAPCALCQNFLQPSIVPTRGGQPAAVYAADLNSDGVSDLVYIESGASAETSTTHVLLSDGVHFTQLPTLPGTPAVSGPTSAPTMPVMPGQVVLADLGGDGYADVIAPFHNVAGATSASRSRLYVWFGDGSGHFSDPIVAPPRRHDYLAVAGDLNGGGLPEIALSDGTLIAVLYNEGPRRFGSETHLLAGQGINQLALADLNGDGNLDPLAANGGATIASPLARAGAAAGGVLETLVQNPDVDNRAVTVLLCRLDTLGATVSVTATPEPSEYGQAFTLTATVTSPAADPTSMPTGSVAFTLNGKPVGSAPIVAGSATLPVNTDHALVPGVYTFSAAYEGDSQFPASVPASGLHTLVRAPTTVTLQQTTPPIVSFGQGIDGTYKILWSNGAVLDGTYTLLDNSVAVPSCTALPVGATCPYGFPQLLDAGPHLFVVAYLGSELFAPSQSAPVAYRVLPDPTQATLTSSLDPAPVGTVVTFTAKLTGSIALPVGMVQFLDGANVLGTGALVAGSARFSTDALTRGTHAITAVYAGTENFLPATTGPLSEQVVALPVKLPTALSLVSDQNPAPARLPVNFTASVTVPGPFPIAASGSVIFSDGSTQIGSAPLDAYGVARFQTATLLPGPHPITAAYGGALNDSSRGNTAPLLPSISPVLTEIITDGLAVAPVGFVLTVSPTPLTIGPGRAAVLLADVRAESGFAQPVALSCAGLPPETTCLFAQPVIPPGGGSTTVEVLTAAPHDCGNPGQPYFLASLGRGALPLLAALLLLCVPGRRRLGTWRALAVLLTLGLGLTAVSGCGHCTDLGTRPGTYTFTVVGTAQGGPLNAVQQQTVTMTVQLP